MAAFHYNECVLPTHSQQSPFPESGRSPAELFWIFMNGPFSRDRRALLHEPSVTDDQRLASEGIARKSGEEKSGFGNVLDGRELAVDGPSYAPSFGGGLRRDGTFIEYSKNLIDRLHPWYTFEPNTSQWTRSRAAPIRCTSTTACWRSRSGCCPSRRSR